MEQEGRQPAHGSIGIPVELVELICRRCSGKFELCRSCYRGQAYCGDACRQAARRDSIVRARGRYASSRRGRLKHQDRQNHYRRESRKRNVTDHSSTEPGGGPILGRREDATLSSDAVAPIENEPPTAASVATTEPLARLDGRCGRCGCSGSIRFRIPGGTSTRRAVVASISGPAP